jgi:hypothetical protein
MGPPGRIVTLARQRSYAYSRILRPRRSPVTCATCGLHSAQPRVVRDYLELHRGPTGKTNRVTSIDGDRVYYELPHRLVPADDLSNTSGLHRFPIGEGAPA